MLEDLFAKIIEMSVTSCYVIAVVTFLRLALRKAPKVVSYSLWSVVLFRLTCPFSFESIISLIPKRNAAVAPLFEYISSPVSPFYSSQTSYNFTPVAPSPAQAVALHISPMLILSLIWLIGITVLIIYSILSLIRLTNKLGGSTLVCNNIYTANCISTPFVLGIIRPKIYLPESLSEEEKSYIILHEQTHIKRFDHVIKLIGFFVVCIHWFNPLAWAAFFLCSKDMEMSCDERVIKQLGSEIKCDYSSSLLSLATGRKIIGGTPLAFGEGDTKSRIKNVLNYKKPAFWVVIVAAIAAIAVSIGLVANPATTVKISHIDTGLTSKQLQYVTGMSVRTPANLGIGISGNKEIKKATAFIEGLKIYKTEINQSREGDRDKSNQIIMFKTTDGRNYEEYLNFNEDFTEVWFDNNTKPTFSYKVAEPKKIMKFFDDTLTDGKSTVFNNSASELVENYKLRLVARDITGIRELMPALNPPIQEQILQWKELEISNVEALSEDIREDKAYFELTLTVDKIPDGFEMYTIGENKEFLYAERSNNGWYIESVGAERSPKDLEKWWDTPNLISNNTYSGYNGVDAVILEIDYAEKTMLVEGIGKNSVIGDKCQVNCKGAKIISVIQGNSGGDVSELQFEKLMVGDEVRLNISAVAESYPTQATASTVQVSIYLPDYGEQKVDATSSTLTKETATQFINQTLSTFALNSDNTVSFTLPQIIPTDENGKTNLFISSSATFSSKPGSSSMQKLLDDKDGWKGGETYKGKLDMSKGELKRLFLRVAFNTSEDENSHQIYVADYIEFTEPFKFDTPVKVADRNVAINRTGTSGVLKYTMQNGEKFSIALTLPKGVTLSAAENSSPSIGEMPAVAILKDGASIGGLTLSDFGTDDKDVLAQVDTAENALPMQIFSPIALSNHAEFDNYKVCKSSATGANAVAKYYWQDLTDYGGRTPDAPWLPSDAVLAYDYEKIPFFIYVNLDDGSLTAAELENLAKSIIIYS